MFGLRVALYHPHRTLGENVCLWTSVVLVFNRGGIHNLCVFIPQEISRRLRPNTLRALYGKDKVKNAVHCTDLPEDGILEVGAVTNTHIFHPPCGTLPRYFICGAPLILSVRA